MNSQIIPTENISIQNKVIEKMNYEIISPEIQSSFNPKGKDVLLLLSGKITLTLNPNKTFPISRENPVVIDRPYSLICPAGPGTGRALRITLP